MVWYRNWLKRDTDSIILGAVNEVDGGGGINTIDYGGGGIDAKKRCKTTGYMLGRMVIVW